MSSAINPYQPPPSGSSSPAELNAFEFRLTKRNLNYGQSHHLLRCRPVAAIVVSLIMIVISVVLFSYAVFLLGPVAALGLMPLLLGGAAVAYLWVMREPKLRTQERMNECGLLDGGFVTIHVEPDELVADIEGVATRWPRENIKRYQTPRGLMIVPEQYVYFFLPRFGQFDRPTYRAIANLFPNKKSEED